MNNLSFSELPLSKEVQKSLQEMGFEEATPIQSQAILPIMEGIDIIGQAQTGTGKTCAFGIPVIENLDPHSRDIQILILSPTRELAMQTAEELQNVAKYKRGVQILPIYGGQSIDRQIMALKKKPQIIIGTPGRVMDHMRRGTLKLQNLRTIVLDEADEMLNMGFREDIDVILEEVPEERQTILFSATMPKAIMDLVSKYQKNPKHIQIAHKEVSAPLIEQYYIEVRDKNKFDALTRLIEANNIKLSLTFCKTKVRVDELTAKLQTAGYLVEALHGDMRQAQRDKVMARFREGKLEMLVATDVAARGIDVNNIEAVFNYDLPNDEEYYVHRIGRTGRAGHAGKAYSFVFGRELYKIKDIQRYTKSQIKALKPPTLIDLERTKVNSLIEQIKATVLEGSLDKYHKYIETMLEECTSGDDDNTDITTLDVASAMLKMFLGTALNQAEGDVFAENSNIPNPNKARLFINLGKIDGTEPRTIIDLIASCSDLTQKQIGSIEICDKFSFVDVPKQYGEILLQTIPGRIVNNRKVNVELANRNKGSRGERENRGGSSRGERGGDRNYKSSNPHRRSSLPAGVKPAGERSKSRRPRDGKR